jgi:hypothetical protein
LFRKNFKSKLNKAKGNVTELIRLSKEFNSQDTGYESNSRALATALADVATVDNYQEISTAQTCHLPFNLFLALSAEKLIGGDNIDLAIDMLQGVCREKLGGFEAVNAILVAIEKVTKITDNTTKGDLLKIAKTVFSTFDGDTCDDRVKAIIEKAVNIMEANDFEYLYKLVGAFPLRSSSNAAIVRFATKEMIDTPEKAEKLYSFISSDGFGGVEAKAAIIKAVREADVEFEPNLGHNKGIGVLLPALLASAVLGGLFGAIGDSGCDCPACQMGRELGDFPVKVAIYGMCAIKINFGDENELRNSIRSIPPESLLEILPQVINMLEEKSRHDLAEVAREFLPKPKIG